MVNILKTNLYNLSIDELRDFFIGIGEKSFRADQLWDWLYVKGIKKIENMNNISKILLEEINANYYIPELKIKKYLESTDGTKKWLFEMEDKKEIETVYIPDDNRGTICISSQVGCTLSCSFCHTGTMKFLRNLSMAEIVGQVIQVKNELKDWNKNNERKITNIVFMGMGEPLYNYENVIKTLNVLTDEKGLAISKRKITLSTSGVVPKIKIFKDDSDVNLAVSLHAAFDKIRNELVPINKKWPISVLLEALKEYSFTRKNKRITFEYIMLKNINDSLDDARELIKLIRPFKAKINLIPFNPWPGSKYQVSSEEKIQSFKNYILDKGNLVATIRTPRGEDVLAACGQLKAL